MALLKCEMCGGDLNVAEGMTVCECDYCGHKQIVNTNEKETIIEKTIIQQGSKTASVESYLKRAFTFLEDGNYRAANQYCEKVLDIEPENAEAYLGKLMAEMQVKERSELNNCSAPFDDSDNFNKVMRFGSSELQAELRGYIAHINEQNENARIAAENARMAEIYESTVGVFNTTRIADYREKDFLDAAEKFKTISGYKDADQYYVKCLENASACHKIKDYSHGKWCIKAHHYDDAIKTFESLPGYEDADRLLAKARHKKSNLAKRRMLFFGVYFADVAAVIAFWIILFCMADTITDPPLWLAVPVFAGAITHSIVSGLIGKMCDAASDKFRSRCTIAVNALTKILVIVGIIGSDELIVGIIVAVIDFAISLIINKAFH